MKRTFSVAILTLGCPKNEVDSQAMASLLQESGFRLVGDPSRARYVVVNTCGFIEPARAESLGELKTLAAAKRRGQKLVAAGCLAELDPHMLLAEVPGLDGVLGTRRWHELPKLLPCLDAGAQPPVWVGDSNRPSPQPRRFPAGATAYVKIAEGCSGPCAFCTIPRIKGPYRSRSREEVIAEVVDLVGRGYKEVILVAQDTTAYGRDRGERDGLPALVEGILDRCPELPWLRLMYTYPQHVSERLVELMGSRSQVCRYVDLPLQHAHPAALRRMHRPADVDAILRLIERLRKAMPDVALRTAFIVGYPGETEEEFEALLRFVRAVRFDHVGAFAYSPEPGTPAHEMGPRLPEEVKEERRARLLQEQQAISLEINRSLVGERFEVLVEGKGDGMSVGRTYRDAPEVDGLALLTEECEPGRFVCGRVMQAMEYDLLLEPVPTTESAETRVRNG